MRKLLSLILAILTMSLCLVPAYATTDEELESIFAEQPDWDDFHKMTFAAGYMGYITDDVMNPLILTVQDSGEGYKIEATYVPEFYVDYFYNNPYYTIQPDDYTIMQIDIRIDEGQWLSETGTWGAISRLFTTYQTFPGILNEETTFTLLDLSDVPEELEDGPYFDILEFVDGKYTIDLTKHTIEVRHTIIYNNNENRMHQMLTSPVVRAIKLTQGQMPQTLNMPVVQRTVISKQNNTLSFKLTPDAEIRELQQMGHECYLLVQYTFNNKTYSVNPIAITDEIYHITPIEKLKWIDSDKQTESQNNSVTVQYAYKDNTTNISSEWVSCKAFVQETPDKATVDNYFQNPDKMPPQLICGLCHKCSHPLNICMWLLIPGTTLLLGSITGFILFAVKNTKYTNKENNRCQSKNSKTPK